MKPQHDPTELTSPAFKEEAEVRARKATQAVSETAGGVRAPGAPPSIDVPQSCGGFVSLSATDALGDALSQGCRGGCYV